jgi:diguanylate cyclase (GGDEF)-like protein
MIDIDHFKHVNDTFGHQVGDVVLVSLAATYRENLREVDLIGRYGGEEFIILLPETDLSQAAATAERLRLLTTQLKIPGSHLPIHITVSIGYNTWHPEINYSLDEAIRRADEALYRAKSSGRDQIVQGV